MDDRDPILSDYRRLIDDEVFRSQREHALFEVLVRYPDLLQPRDAVAERLRASEAIAMKPRLWNVGMTAPEEQAYCEWFASHIFRGSGEWIELGTFLGSLTIASANGLRVNPNPAARHRRIQSFDLFRWDAMMTSSVKGTPFEGRGREGESYVDLFRETIAGVADLVDVHEADLVWYRYGGKPIEFLMVDVMKHEYLVANVLAQFFGHVLPGVGHVFHQDYLHFYEGWITLSMYALRDYFTVRGEMGAAVVFRCEREIPGEKLAFPLVSTVFERSYIEEAFDWSYSVIAEAHHHEVTATKIMMLVHAGLIDDAAEVYRAAVPRYPGSYSFSWMTDYLRDDRGLIF